MKHWTAWLLILAIAAVAVALGEGVRPEVSPAPDALLYLIADAERDLTRIPVSLDRFSDEEERKIGDKLAKGFAESLENPSEEDRLIAKYVSDMGAKLSSHARRKFPYHFYYIPQEYMINAFALPGGHIYIGKGLLELLNSDDELASTLSHEIEHVELRHAAERAQIHARITRNPLGALFSIPIVVFQAGYSKEQEFESDREGTRLAVTSGYSALGAINAFRKLERLEDRWRGKETPRQQASVIELPFKTLDVVLAKSLEGYFRSHPPSRIRRERIERFAKEQNYSADSPRPLRIAYMLRRDRARRFLAQGDLPGAWVIAREAVELNPSYPPALNLLADIEFERADFTQSSLNYAKSLDLNPAQPTLYARFAISLAVSSSPADAATQFDRKLSSIATKSVQIESAGLHLIAGDSKPAAVETQALATYDGPDRPVLLARLGWWYVRSGDAPAAEKLLNQALERNPQDPNIRSTLIWAEIAQQKYNTAQGLVANNTSSDQAILSAVIAWSTSGNKFSAASDYASAVAARQVWANPRWVTAIHGAKTEAVIAAIRAEHARLKAGRLF